MRHLFCLLPSSPHLILVPDDLIEIGFALLSLRLKSVLGQSTNAFPKPNSPAESTALVSSSQSEKQTGLVGSVASVGAGTGVIPVGSVGAGTGVGSELASGSPASHTFSSNSVQVSSPARTMLVQVLDPSETLLSSPKLFCSTKVDVGSTYTEPDSSPSFPTKQELVTVETEPSTLANAPPRLPLLPKNWESLMATVPPEL
mmetsp:Transcript_1491/g.2530  ORF Transcript_1491/g.2530 Transcript_1491/m.2530 type:complete len:201 (+) Transcript_1491:826-1428(+)